MLYAVIRRCHSQGPKCDNSGCPTLVCQLCTPLKDAAERCAASFHEYGAEVHDPKKLPDGVDSKSLQYIANCTGDPYTYEPFKLKRIGPAGPDAANHLFCAMALGNPELVRTGETNANTLINGTNCREPVQKLVAALNEVWARYMLGEFS